MAKRYKVGGIPVGTQFKAASKNGADITFPYGYLVSSPTGGEGPPPSDPVGTYAGDISRLPADMEGRVTRIVIPAQNVTQARIKTQPAPNIGWGSVNPDNTISLRLEMGTVGQACSLVYEYQTSANPGVWVEGTYSIAEIALAFGNGWGIEGGFEAGLSPYYQQDANRKSIIAPGENHRKVHVSMTGHTAAAIASAHAIDVSLITNAWLLTNTAHVTLGGDGTVKYGETPATALHKDVGLPFWYSIMPNDNAPASHWLLFKAGEDFGNTGSVLKEGHNAESVMFPIRIGKYGTGADPIITNKWHLKGNLARSKGGIAVQELNFAGTTAGFQFESFSQGDRTRIDIFLEDLTVQGPSAKNDNQWLDTGYGFTLRRLRIFDQWLTDPKAFSVDSMPTEFVDPQIDSSSLNSPRASHILYDECFFDWSAMQRGYNYFSHIEQGMTPSPLGHPIYTKSSMGVVVRDTLLSRSGGDHGQFRAGVCLINNLLIMNNGPMAIAPGDARTAGQPTGQFSTLYGNIIHMGGYHQAVHPTKDYYPNWSAADEVANWDPNKWLRVNNQTDGTFGIGAPYTSLVDNLIVHSDPEKNRYSYQTRGTWASATRERFGGYKSAPRNNTIVYGWVEGPNQNAEQVNPSVANVTTLPNYFREHVGPVAASDFYLDDGFNWWRGLATSGNPNDWRNERIRFTNYMREGFGFKPVYTRTTPKTMRFFANPITDGKYWWNPLNWSSEELPIDGDAILLAGCRTRYGYLHLTVPSINFGTSGGLIVETGYLRVSTTDLIGTDKLLGTRYCGQLRIAGYSGTEAMNVACSGGWFVNEGTLAGNVEYAISGEGKAALAKSGGSFTLGAGRTMTITGGKCRVGTDGVSGGTATINLAGTVTFVQDSTGMAKIGEFHSGLHGAVPNNVNLVVNVTGTINATGVTSGTVLVQADTLTTTGATLTNCRVVGQTIVAGTA